MENVGKDETTGIEKKTSARKPTYKEHTRLPV